MMETVEQTKLKETFKLKRNIDNYVEQWENTKSDDDPLLRSWKDYLEENQSACRKNKRKTK